MLAMDRELEQLHSVVNRSDEMVRSIKLFDIVALTGDLPEAHLLRGQVGTVIKRLTDGAA